MAGCAQRKMSRSHCLAVTLACPVGMGLTMWIAMCGHGRTHQTVNPGSRRVEELRAEIGRLKAERATDIGTGTGPVTVGMTGRGKPASSWLVAVSPIYYLCTYVVDC
jgi:hypothetical protein